MSAFTKKAKRWVTFQLCHGPYANANRAIKAFQMLRSQNKKDIELGAKRCHEKYGTLNGTVWDPR